MNSCISQYAIFPYDLIHFRYTVTNNQLMYRLAIYSLTPGDIYSSIAFLLHNPITKSTFLRPHNITVLFPWNIFQLRRFFKCTVVYKECHISLNSFFPTLDTKNNQYASRYLRIDFLHCYVFSALPKLVLRGNICQNDFTQEDTALLIRSYTTSFSEQNVKALLLSQTCNNNNDDKKSTKKKFLFHQLC